MKNYMLEVCVDSVESALVADKAGGKRLELCSNLVIGGTSPSKCLYEEIRKYTNIPIHVLLRPRYGDFCYTDAEFSIIKNEVAMFRDLGTNGIVIGILNVDGSLDEKRMELLMQEAGDMQVTLHRAFDMCKDSMDTLEKAKNLGIHTILTSGQKNNCVDGEALLKQLVEKSKGSINILVGSGVNAEVIKVMYEKTDATQFHMSGKAIIDSSMTYRKEGVSMGVASMDEYGIWRTQESEIKKAVTILENLF